MRKSVSLARYRDIFVGSYNIVRIKSDEKDGAIQIAHTAHTLPTLTSAKARFLGARSGLTHNNADQNAGEK